MDVPPVVWAGQTIEDVRAEVFYDEQAAETQNGVAVSGPIAWKGGNGKGICYVEFDWSGPDLYGDRELQFALIAKQGAQWTSHWDGSNDFSRQGMTDTYAITDRVPLYRGNRLIYGTESDKSAPSPPTSLRLVGAGD